MDGSTASHWEDARLFIDICAIPLEFWFSTLWFFFGCTKKCVSLLATSVLQERMGGIVFYCWCLGLFFWRRKKGRCFTEVVCFLFFFVGTSMSEHENSGKISELYRSLCGKEQEQSMKNPEIKSVYAPIFDSIRSMCMTFQNEINSAKIHLPKAPPKQRRKSKVEPVE